MSSSTVHEKSVKSGKISEWGRVFSTGRLSSFRLSISPLLPLALLPMVALIGIVGVFVWVSAQTGVLGTPSVRYSLENYRILFGDSFVLEVLENTLIFAAVTTAVSLVIGLPVAWITERTTIHPKELIRH